MKQPYLAIFAIAFAGVVAFFTGLEWITPIALLVACNLLVHAIRTVDKMAADAVQMQSVIDIATAPTETNALIAYAKAHRLPYHDLPTLKDDVP